MAITYVVSLKHLLSRGEFPSESSIFRLHYQFTTALCVGSSIFLTANEFFGENINCLTDEAAKNVMDTYCWIKSTFTMDDYQYREVGKSVAQPGVLSPDGYSEEELEAKWTFHNYYQWVVFFLCFQAALFYLPKLIWSSVEGGLMRSIANGLNPTLYKDEDVGERKRVVVEYITTHIKMHNSYVYKYWICEVYCFANLIVQLYLVDRFLGNQFFTYGTEVMKYSNMDQTERVDPMIYIFPRMTKCLFHKYGASGSIQRFDAFCLLPLNILNEKIFILQWFWFIILAALFGVLLLYRLMLLFVPGLRPRVMHQHNRAVPMEALEAFTQKTRIGDWWILYILSKNIDPLIYKDIMSKLAKEIETNASNNPYPSSAPSMFSSSSV